MTETQWREWVVGSLHRIEVGLVGVQGDQSNTGLTGRVGHTEDRINYIEGTTLKREILPRVRKLEDGHASICNDLNTHVKTQTAWRNGLTFALGIATALVAVLGFAQFA